MKKPILAVLAIALTVAGTGCTKFPNPLIPVSSFNISFNNKTINDSLNLMSDMVSTTGTSGGYTTQFQAIDHQISALFSGTSSNAVGTYVIDGSTVTNHVTDNTVSPSQVYYFKHDNSSSTVTITVSNSKEVKGTFNFVLTNGGADYTATGSFDYYNM